ncbi:hypothetical protein [Micromonospora sp. WMMD737]|uniref:hypothetical protein n=1 Tax=Micromonospora sp. WMMD737 TaxID=3404113 RepID=UPI003B941641
MPQNMTRRPTAWTPAFVADVVADVLGSGESAGLYRAATLAAQIHRIPAATVWRWVASATGIETVSLPPGLVVCRLCAHPMVLVDLPEQEPCYTCRSACPRRPLPAAQLSTLIAEAMLQRVPHLVPRGRTHDAALYAPGIIRRITVGATPTDLYITWHPAPRRLYRPDLTTRQRLDLARQRMDAGDVTDALGLLETGLLQVDPRRAGATASDETTATAAVLYAQLLLTTHHASTAITWAAYGHRSLRNLLGKRQPATCHALKVLASAHRHAGYTSQAADLYAELATHLHHMLGPRALPTIAAYATHALLLFDSGDCFTARQLLADTLANHKAQRPGHPDGPRMQHELDRMRRHCVTNKHRHAINADA